jgi:N-acetylneuraminate synthase
VAVTLIAEVGVNHDGRLDRGLELIDVAADCGVDVVKFQFFRADLLATPQAPQAAYQKASAVSDENQFAMLKRLELAPEAFLDLAERCRERNVSFLCTPFDGGSLRYLVDKVGVGRLKMASGEITNGPLLLEAAQTGLPVILSTGMSTLAEVETALAVMAFGYVQPDNPTRDWETFRAAFASDAGQHALRAKVTLLHCTSEYPAPPAEANLRAIDALAHKFDIPVGLSDHTPGISISLAAVARGAVVIEKHFTLDRALSGPDHRASLDPIDLRNLVIAVREVESALGSGVKQPTASELPNLPVVRKSLVALSPIRTGEVFTKENVGARRPGGGRSPMRWWETLGVVAGRDYQAGEALE